MASELFNTYHPHLATLARNGSIALPNQCIFLVLVTALPYLFAISPSTSAPQPEMLSADAFARAGSFISSTGRPLERALFAFHFAHGGRDAVIAELAKFQNMDGGFASDLDGDTRWSGSSPMGTMIGLRILNEVKAPAEDPHLQAAVRYLLANFEAKKGYWHALPKEANSAPHAPWWNVREDTGKCEVESPVFPTAAIAGYLQAYSALLPHGFLEKITNSSLRYLSTAPTRMPMPDIETLTTLVQFLPANKSSEAVAKLNRVLASVVERDPQKWTRYTVQPLTFIHTPDSPFNAGLKDAIPPNLDYIISSQQADGGWNLTWSWEKIDPVAWRTAEREWRAVVALENLEKLDSFRRINH
jgi:hypothetical protein